MDDSVAPRTLYGWLVEGDSPTVLDVRSRTDFEAWRVDGPGVRAVQVPQVEFLAAQARGDVADLAAEHALDGPVVVVCAKGESSDHVAGLLREAGIEAANLEEGMRGWARLLVAREVPGGPEGATVVQYDRPATGCLSYLVVAGDAAAAVDPLRAFAGRYAADAADRGADLVAAVDTHVHADHRSAVRVLAAATGADPVLPAGAADRGLGYEVRTLADGDAVTVGDHALTAVDAPGHTPELQVLCLGDVCLTADALFLDGVGRPDLLGDDRHRERAATLYDTLHDVLLEFPGATVALPGHHEAGSVPEGEAFAAPLGDLRDRLELLGVDRTAFVDRVAAADRPRPVNHEAIVAWNLGRGETGGYELELGPNNCAA